ncbi:MAG: hypothetical protein AAB402_04870 [Patescibacteria group bacterium]
MNSNVWFYTLSTIAQTCGTILALGGTFVIFRFDKLQTALGNYRGRIVRIVQTWRGDSKKPDAFFDESDRDVRDQYLTIVRDNEEQLDNLFNEHIDGLYEAFEGRPIKRGLQGSQQEIINQVRAERERWCTRMVDLYSKNIEMKQTIHSYLKWALILLTLSILFSVVLLSVGFDSSIIKVAAFLVTVIISAISIVYTAIAVWKIGSKNPIM